MGRLFYFLYRFRALFLFIILEIASSWLIVVNNQYHNAHFFNSSNSLAAAMFNVSQEMKNYFLLRKINLQVTEENTRLKEKLSRQNQSIYSLHVNYFNNRDIANQFSYINAEIINNSIYRFKNYITIDKGMKAGIKPNMAVIGPLGIVGKVKATSAHYAVVISLLNTDVHVSGVIKNTHNFGTIKWRGKDHEYTYLDFIPRHASPTVGDTVVTSGFNAIFPKNIPIGTINSVELSKEAPFYTLEVKLAQDFAQLAFVQVIQNRLKTEKDSLEQIVITTP